MRLHTFVGVCKVHPMPATKYEEIPVPVHPCKGACTCRPFFAYVRVSEVGARGDDLISPELQLVSIVDRAARTGQRIVKVVTDIDKTGRNFAKRQVQKMVNSVAADEVAGVALWKWSRWGRNLAESQFYLAQMEAVGGEVTCSTEDFDRKTTMGKFTSDQMLLIAELFSNQMSDGWKETHARRRSLGLPHTATARYGYSYSRETGYTISEPEATILRDLYKRYIAGEKLYALTQYMNEVGPRELHGKPWKPAMVGRVLDTGFAAGLIRERSNPNAKGMKTTRTLKSFDVWRVGAHEAIIDMDTWEAFKAKREATALKAPRLRRPVHALSGLVHCGVCGNRMSAAYSGKHNKNSWMCVNARDSGTHSITTISNARVMTLVLEWLAEQVGQASDDVTATAKRLEQARVATISLDACTAEVARLTRKRARIAELAADEVISAVDAKAQRTEVEAALAVAEAGRTSALAARDEAGVDRVRAFGAVLDEWERFTPGEQNEALTQIIKRIVVTPNEVRGHYSRVQMVEAWATE